MKREKLRRRLAMLLFNADAQQLKSSQRPRELERVARDGYTSARLCHRSMLNAIPSVRLGR